MATGKSTIGKKLSKKLDMDFLDTDEWIEKTENRKISNIFKEKGENYFREVETKTLEALENKENMVLSTGGGIVERKVNFELLKKMGTVIWLNGNKNTIIRNLKSSKEERPLLKVKNIEEKIEELLNKRIEKYKQVSQYTVDIDNKSIEEVIGNILLNLNKV